MFCIATIDGVAYLVGCEYNLDQECGFTTTAIENLDYISFCLNAYKGLRKSERNMLFDMAIDGNLMAHLGLAGTLRQLTFMPRDAFRNMLQERQAVAQGHSET